MSTFFLLPSLTLLFFNHISTLLFNHISTLLFNHILRMGNNGSRRLTTDLHSLPSSPESSESLSTSTQDGSDRSQQSLASIRLEPIDVRSTGQGKKKRAALITGRNRVSNMDLPPIEWPDFSSGKVLPFKEYKKWLTSFRSRESEKKPMNRCKTATFRINRSGGKERSEKVFVIDEEKRRRAENCLDLKAINHAMTQPRNKVLPVTQLNVRQLKPCHWFDNSTDASKSTMAVIRTTRSSAVS